MTAIRWSGPAIREFESALDYIARDNRDAADRLARTIHRAVGRLRAFPDSGRMVALKAELKARIMRYLQDLNADPVVFRWRYKIEEESVS